MPKPRIEIDIKTVEQLASRGLTLEQIASSMGFSIRTLMVRKAESAEIADAIKRGRDKGVTIIANKLFEAASGGNTAAMIFFLKTQGGWKEAQKIEVEAKVETVEQLTTEQLMEIAKLPLEDEAHQ